MQTAPSPISESRRAGPDGWLWPVDRAEMREPGPIRQRMSQDIEAGRRALTPFTCFGEAELAALGWTWPQIRSHAAAAFAAVKAERKALTRRAA